MELGEVTFYGEKNNICLLSALIGTIYYSARQFLSQKTISVISDKYGINYNQVRKANKIPIVENNWIKHEADSSHIFWSNVNRSVDKVEPLHFYKITYLKSGLVSFEQDAFHYQTSGDKAYRLMVFSYFNDKSDTRDSTKYMLRTYYKNEYKPEKSLIISETDGDSILSKWKELIP